MTRISLEVNGRPHAADVEPRLLLSDFLRDHLHLTGTHVGCEQGVCGSCTVQIDGKPARSCLTLAVQADGTSIRTVEALAPPDPGSLHPLQDAFHRHHALQCGYCTPGFLMSIDSMLPDLRDLSDEQIREQLAGNLCRCTGYQNIVEATREAIPEVRTVEIEHLIEVDGGGWASISDTLTAWRGELAVGAARFRGIAELLDVDETEKVAHFDFRANEVDAPGQLRGIVRAALSGSTLALRAELELVATSAEPDPDELRALADAIVGGVAREHAVERSRAAERPQSGASARWIPLALAFALAWLFWRTRRGRR
jgi:aerobic-type carbon monoxide dehydrogenase small subunit (CoxS/CutS family)